MGGFGGGERPLCLSLRSYKSNTVHRRSALGEHARRSEGQPCPRGTIRCARVYDGTARFGSRGHRHAGGRALRRVVWAQGERQRSGGQERPQPHDRVVREATHEERVYDSDAHDLAAQRLLNEPPQTLAAACSLSEEHGNAYTISVRWALVRTASRQGDLGPRQRNAWLAVMRRWQLHVSSGIMAVHAMQWRGRVEVGKSAWRRES